MKRKWTVFWYFLLIATLFTGCASKKARLVYEPVHCQSAASTNLVLGIEKLSDARAYNKIDLVFEGDPIETINGIIHEEIHSTGMFDQLVRISKEEPGNADASAIMPDLLMSASLLELNWIVPGYKRMQEQANTMAFTSGLLGGLVGGAVFVTAYGMSQTDVKGHALMKFKVVDCASQEVLLEKEYIGDHKEKKSKLKCDLPETKVCVIGKALGIIMQDFKKDLVQLVQTSNEVEVQEAAQTETDASGLGSAKDTALK